MAVEEDDLASFLNDAQAEASQTEQDRRDDNLINDLLTNPEGIQIPVDARPEDLGPKADDAVDYEDWGDDDLASEEDEPVQKMANGTKQKVADNGHGADTGAQDDLDDLFGGGDYTQSPELEKQFDRGALPQGFEGDDVLGQPIGPVQDDFGGLFGEDQDEMQDVRDDLDDIPNLSKAEKDALRLQRTLFAQAGNVFAPVQNFFDEEPQNQEEALAQMWPKFKKNETPRFVELMPYKKARWVGKKPTKIPKPVHPTKLKLEIAPDQEKHFKLNYGPQKRKRTVAQENGVIYIIPNEVEEATTDEEDADNDFTSDIAGLSWQEIQTICANFDLIEPEESSDFELLDSDVVEARPPKRRKHNDGAALVQHILNKPLVEDVCFDNYEKLLAKSAKRVVLDPRDPNLLLVPMDYGVNPRKTAYPSLKNGQRMSIKDRFKRYNISNDAAYDKLKQNHQSKIRSTLGSLTLNHSMPALRLTYPFYKTDLSRDERRRLHRPVTKFPRRAPIQFHDLKFIKKKHQKNRDPKEMFDKATDLGLDETSYSLLLEYSEEAPTMLSNFGMSSRLISYYRKKTAEDDARPKVNLGEVNILMPNDTSPLTQFGEIKPGEIRPTIYNAMYKAPVFEHKGKPSDFLMIRKGTDALESKWYIRPIEYLMVVGQQFPSTEVPPPGGRRVTTVSKNRLKSISYRLMRQNKNNPGVNISKVTEHVAESSDMQNRQKMKEFLSFNKETKEWEMQGKAPVPDEDVIRSFISPEDVCLLESMQVGEQRLEDEGYGHKQSNAVDQELDERREEGLSIPEQLAPWATTKNFLSAASNKAMLQLYGEGDPTGRMEAFSFLKVSMKGGFRAPNQSIEDTLDAKKRQESSGHNYNVQRQQEQYRETIADIWERQNQSLSSKVEIDLPEPDSDDEPESMPGRSMSIDPRASFARRNDDDTGSAWSSVSNSGMACRIVRNVRNRHTGQIEEEEEVIDDPMVWKRYMRIKDAQRFEKIDLNRLTGEEDPELVLQMQEQELARLKGNQERRHAREKQKAAATGDAGSPGGSGPGKGGSTTRKCANCGQVGHIKTNKKLCPLLNGTSRPEDGGFGDAFAASTPDS